MVGADVDVKSEGRDDDTEASKGLSFNILTTVSFDKLPGRKNMTSAFFSYSMSNSQSSDPTVSTYAYHFSVLISNSWKFSRVILATVNILCLLM